MTIEKKIKASLISSFIEVGVTHPIDYLKTLKQDNKYSFNKFLKNPYNGVSSRLIGVAPMRLVYWNSISFFKEKNYSSLKTGIYASSLQTILDYPIEQIKIRRMLQSNNIFKNTNHFLGFITLLSRNIGFCITFVSSINYFENDYYSGAIGGLTGAFITQPFDSLKTHYQSGKKTFPKWKFKQYMVGWQHRCIISMLSMNIGWLIYNNLNK